MRTIFQLAVLGALATPAGAESLEVLGYAGVLGEWELTASVTGNDNTKAYSGPLTMTHVGICTQDGPEKRSGEIRFQITESSSRLKATMVLDGVECSFGGKRSDFYSGAMVCADRRVFPLKLWVK